MAEKGDNMTANMKQPSINLNDRPRYAAAAQKLGEVQHSLIEAEARKGEILLQLNTMGFNSARGDSITQQAMALLNNDAPGNRARESDLRSELADLYDRIAILGEAVSLQKGVLENERVIASGEVCETLAPEHRILVRQIVHQAVKLAGLLAEEYALRDNLQEKGILYSAYIRPMPMRGVGRLADANSRINAYLKECEEFGFIVSGEFR
jgi:hypothetical protein